MYIPIVPEGAVSNDLKLPIGLVHHLLLQDGLGETISVKLLKISSSNAKMM